MLAQGFLALLSHWRRKPLQLAMFVLGLALATALWSAVQAINGEARASYARAAAVLGQDRLSFLAREDGARFNEEIVETLRSAGWRVSPVVEGERRFGDVRLRIIGVDPASLPPESGASCLRERALTEADPAQGKASDVATRTAADETAVVLADRELRCPLGLCDQRLLGHGSPSRA